MTYIDLNVYIEVFNKILHICFKHTICLQLFSVYDNNITYYLRNEALDVFLYPIHYIARSLVTIERPNRKRLSLYIVKTIPAVI